MRRFLLAFALVTVVVSGCKKASTGGSGDDDQTTPDATDTTTAGTVYSLQWGPVTVPSGVAGTGSGHSEDTQCIILQLPNTLELKVHEIHNTLSNGSHHMIVYKDDMDTAEQTTPTDCQPFTGALNTTGNIAPVVITQKQDDDIVLPDGVAYTFAPNQFVKIEMHYINSSDSPEVVTGTVEFVAADGATIHDEANILFTGTPDVGHQPGGSDDFNGVPPGQSTTHEFFTLPVDVDLSTSHVYAVTGHEHKWGMGVTVNVGASPTGTLTPVYDPATFLWSEPPTQDGDFSVPTGGGFDFSCTWVNTSGVNVKFGESANDEMCFFWAYYWPSQGSKVCIHTDNPAYTKYGVQDICCPSDDPTNRTYCAFASSIFNPQ
jgi:hypothetical protein